MKTAEFLRELTAAGVVLKEGKRHTKAYNGKRQSTVPRHNEIPNNLAKEIKKQLGLN